MGSRAVSRIVITGASSGIGAATAVAFARKGARLVLGARGEAGLADITARCRQAGGDAQFERVDVTDAAALAQFAVPNLSAAMINGFMDRWTRTADRGEDTSGSLFAPPARASGTDGGRRRPGARRTAAIASGALALVGLAAASARFGRRR